MTSAPGPAAGGGRPESPQISQSLEIPERPRLAVSSCLLGEAVRYDGGHKRDSYVQGVLGQWFELVPICPEVGIGLGVPRAPIHLQRVDGQLRVRGSRDPDLDVTDRLAGYADTMALQLAQVSGYVLKARSPSCGMERVRVHGEAGKAGVGAYAAAVMQRFPLLPVEEEGRLNDPGLRENFIVRVLAYARWQVLLAEPLSPAALMQFHARHKLLLLAHNQAGYRRLGPLVAAVDKDSIEEDTARYGREFMQILKNPAGRRGHTNVLQHLMGYLKRELDAADKSELLETIEEFRAGHLPLAAPLTLLRHHFRRHPHDYVAGQVYMAPHPAELALCQHHQ